MAWQIVDNTNIKIIIAQIVLKRAFYFKQSASDYK